MSKTLSRLVRSALIAAVVVFASGCCSKTVEASELPTTTIQVNIDSETEPDILVAATPSLNYESTVVIVDESTPIPTPPFTEVVIGYGPDGIATNEPAEEDGFRYSEAIPLDEDVQHYIWDKCKEYGIKYCFFLSTIEVESGRHNDHDQLVDFNPKAVHHNSNGSTDRGLCQINSCNVKKMKKAGFITCADDLFDIYKNIDCGIFMLGEYVSEYGNVEKSYAVYNSGNPSINHTKASRKVMKYWERWQGILGDI